MQFKSSSVFIEKNILKWMICQFYLFTPQYEFEHFALSMHFTNWRSILSDFLHKNSVFAFPESQIISNFFYFSFAWVCIYLKLNRNIHNAVYFCQFNASFYEKIHYLEILIATCIYILSLRLHILKLLLLMLHSNLTIEIFLGLNLGHVFAEKEAHSSCL